MSKASETRAVNRLRRARAQSDAVKAKYEGWVYMQGGEADRARMAAWNELQAAQWPFVMGKYPWPEAE